MGIRAQLGDIKRALKFEGGFKYKYTYYRYRKIARRKQVADFRIDRVAEMYTYDWLDFEGATKEEKKWFHEQGILSYKLQWYGINKENYQNYISDFDFFGKDNYMNTEYCQWAENKLNTYYLLKPFNKYLPKHYYYVRSGKILPLDVEEKKNGKVEDIVKLVNERPIAAKAVIGGHGTGFYKIEKKEGFYLVNNEKKSLDELKEIIKSLDNYIITDYVIPHKKIREICGDDAFAVMRIIAIYDENDGPQITAVILRLGCKNAGVVTDFSGTIYVGLTLDEGKSFEPIYKENEYCYRKIKNHPDTGVNLEGFQVENWEELKKLVKDVCGYVPMTPYLCVDIIPTDDGFAILEINSHGQVRVIEPHYPFLSNKYNKKLFKINRK